jgi:hypothetical protein
MVIEDREGCSYSSFSGGLPRLQDASNEAAFVYSVIKEIIKTKSVEDIECYQFLQGLMCH